MKRYALALALILTGISQAYATSITITANQDASSNGGSNESWNSWYRWVGDNSYSSYFGFNTSSFTGTVDSVIFSAYHNYWGGNGNISAKANIDTTWNANTLTTNNFGGAFSPTIDTKLATNSNLNQYLSWNLGALSLGNYLTVKLQGNGWNDFAPIANGNHENSPAFLTINFHENQVLQNNVPEPEIIGLLASGILGFGAFYRRKHQA